MPQPLVRGQTSSIPVPPENSDMYEVREFRPNKPEQTFLGGICTYVRGGVQLS